VTAKAPSEFTEDVPTWPSPSRGGTYNRRRRKEHEGSSASRSFAHSAYRGEGDRQGGHHHPRLREGKAPGGQGHRGLALDVKAGDKILFGKYSGTDIKIDGEEYLILREDEVLAVIG
jgi:hypothetical protein